MSCVFSSHSFSTFSSSSSSSSSLLFPIHLHIFAIPCRFIAKHSAIVPVSGFDPSSLAKMKISTSTASSSSPNTSTTTRNIPQRSSRNVERDEERSLSPRRSSDRSLSSFPGTQNSEYARNGNGNNNKYHDNSDNINNINNRNSHNNTNSSNNSFISTYSHITGTVMGAGSRAGESVRLSAHTNTSPSNTSTERGTNSNSQIKVSLVAENV